jgi:RNA polymerase sigma-70 factor (ECF subfamily)
VNDRELTARALAGDESAERALYDAHVDRVYWLAYRMSGRHDLAQDFTQDTFIRAFGRLSEYRGESAFGSWLHAITLSVVLNGLRKAKRFGEREAELEEASMVVTAARESEPDLKERLAKAVDGLPEGCRVAFLMHDVEGYTHEEIGAALGISEGTSKSQLSRARAKLRVALADFAGEWVQ